MDQQVADLFQIMLPLTPRGRALVTLAIFAFQEAWNDFTSAIGHVHDGSIAHTAAWPPRCFQDRSLTKWGPLMAGTTITCRWS